METGLLNPEFGIRNIIQYPLSVIEDKKRQVFFWKYQEYIMYKEETVIYNVL